MNISWHSLEMKNTKSDFVQNIIIATTLDALCNFQKNYQNGFKTNNRMFLTLYEKQPKFY